MLPLALIRLNFARLIIHCPQAMTPVTHDILAISYTPAAGVARFENFNSKHVLL